MRCHEIDGLMDAYFDRELQPASAAEVESHLNACDRCRRRWGGVVTLLTDPAPVRLPAGLRDQIMSRIENKPIVHAADWGCSAAGAGSSVRWMRWYRYSGAVAACVAFFAFGWLISGWRTGSQPEKAPPTAVAEPAAMISPWMLSSWAQAAAMPGPISPAIMLAQGVAPELMIAPASMDEPPTKVRRRLATPTTQPAEPLTSPELRVLPIVPRFIGA